MKHLLSASILLFAIYQAASPASAEPSATGLEGQTVAPQWHINLNAPQVKTEIAAFLILGKRKTDRIYVSDMDILITKDNKRLIPLLRFLRLIEASGEMSNDMVVFKVEDGKRTPIDLLNKTLQVNDRKVPIDIEVGISDMTNETEIYVSEEVLKQAFGFDFTWDPERVEYTITTNKELEVFKRRRLKIVPVSQIDVQKISESLPETEGPARPKAKKPLISFFQTESRTDVRAETPANLYSSYINEFPTLNVWGSVFNGDYKVRIGRGLRYPYQQAYLPTLGSWIDRAEWTSKKDSLLVNVGDSNISLGDLVGSMINLLGATFKWLPGAGDKKELKDRFFKTSRPNFLSDEKFEGYAPTGSDVELFVNNRLVESRLVEEFDGASAGYGYYKFEDVRLFTNSINDVKIVTKRPDGAIEESRREILSVDQLLPAKQFALIGGAGTRKTFMNQKTAFEGFFSGTQALYGLSKDLTLGLTVAAQDGFATIRDEFNYGYHLSPRRYHLAQEARYRLLNRAFTKYNVAVSHDPYNHKNVFAVTANADYYMKRAKVSAQLFSYDPGYSNGVASISDRRGYSLSATWHVFEKLFLKGALLHVYDNLNGALEMTRKEDFFTLAAEVHNVVPRSTLRLQARHLDRLGNIYDTVKGNIYSAELVNSITDNLDITIYSSFEDRVNGLYLSDLSYGLGLAGIDSFYSYGGSIRANYRITPSLSVSSTFYNSYAQNRLEFSSSYNHNKKYHWRSRFDMGMDLKTSQRYFRENVEFDLDKSGENRIGLRCGLKQGGTRYDGGGLSQAGPKYDIGFYVTLRRMFTFKDGEMDNISGMRIYPERGGIQGRVYLDLNCNGHRDPGERGVPNIAVLLDDRQCTESNKKGNFYVLRKDKGDLVTVSLDINNLPAIYTPTQGRQRAYWEEGSFTSVNLGVAVLAAVSGTVKVMDKGAFVKNLSGVRVVLMDKEHGVVLKDSVTAYDGSFYIGQIKPGDYILKIDPDTVPDTAEARGADLIKIKILPVGRPIELEDCDIYLDIKDPEAVKKEIEEVAKRAAALEAKAKPKQRGLTNEIAALDQKLLAGKVREAVLYVYNSLTLPEHTGHRTDAVSISLT